MGTVSSTSKSKEINSRLYDSQNESSEYEKTINSIKNINNKYNSYQGQSETTENTKTADINEQKISYKFEWKEGGNEVKITGSFLDNWSRHEELKKNIITGVYEVVLNIPKGIHEFKFIVDKKWVCSQNYKTINDKMNNSNNIIDLTNYIPSQVIENNNEINSSTKKKKRKTAKDTIEYSCNYPNQSEVNLEAPSSPQNYTPSFDLNFHTKQELLKNIFPKNYFLDKTRNIIENNSFKSIITISHEKLSHICYNFEKDNNYDKYIRTAITQRNKHKFLTLIYYTPKK